MLSGASLEGIIGIVLGKSNEEMVYIETGHLRRPCKEDQAHCSLTPISMAADECPAGQLATGTICFFV